MRLQKIAGILLGIILFSSGATAIDARTFLDNGFDSQGELTPALQGQLAKATAQFQQLPAPIQGIFGNQRVKLEIMRNDGQIDTVGIVLQNNQVLEVTRRAPTNPTLLVQTDEETINQLSQRSNTDQTFLDIVNAGKIKYQGLDAGTSIVTFIASILLWITIFITGIAQFLGMK